MRIIIVDVILRNTFVTTPPLRHGFARAHRHAVPARPPRVAAGRGRAADAAAGLVGAARRARQRPAAHGWQAHAEGLQQAMPLPAPPVDECPHHAAPAPEPPLDGEGAAPCTALAPRVPSWSRTFRCGAPTPCAGSGTIRTAVEPRPRAARTARQLRRPAAVAVRLIAFPASRASARSCRRSLPCVDALPALRPSPFPDPRHDPSP